MASAMMDLLQPMVVSGVWEVMTEGLRFFTDASTWFVEYWDPEQSSKVTEEYSLADGEDEGDDGEQSDSEYGVSDAQLRSFDSLSEDVEYKTQEFKGLDKSIAELSSEGDTTTTELDAVNEYFAKIKDRCIAKPETYEDLKAVSAIVRSAVSKKLATQAKVLAKERDRLAVIDEVERKVRIEAEETKLRQEAERLRIEAEQKAMRDWELYQPPPPPEMTSADRTNEEEQIEIGDIVILDQTKGVPPEYRGHSAIVTSIRDHFCTVTVLDETGQLCEGECWPNYCDITLESARLRVGTRVVVDGLRADATKKFNGKSGVVTKHPDFITKRDNKQRPVICVKFDDESLKISLFEPRFLVDESLWRLQSLADTAALLSDANHHV